MVRWGILGGGRIASQFARDIRFVEGVELRAIASHSNAARFAAEFSIPVAYQDYEALCADGEIDAIYIATPHNFHHDQSLRALASGKAVLCEKPLTVTPDEAQSLIAGAKAHDRYLMEGMWTWFLPAIRTAIEWIEAGRIGKLRHVKADFGYPFPFDAQTRHYDPELAGGTLLDMGIYPLALAVRLLGRDLNIRDAWTHAAPSGVDDDVVTVLESVDALATIACSFRCKLQNVAYLIGEEGYIAIPDFWRASECRLFVLDDEVDRFIDQRHGEGFEFQIDAASRDIEQGRKQSATVPLDSSLAFQQLMDEILRRGGIRGATST